MTVFTETYHDAAFILSEAAGSRSRDNGTVASGNDLVAGTVLMNDAGSRLQAYTGDEFTDGAEDQVVGILINDTDATAGHVAAAYIARDAEVNLNILTYPAASEAKVIAQLKVLGIIARS
jgi:hypothetical protein